MGNNQHRTNKITKFEFQGKKHVYVIVTNDLLLHEHGIIGVSFMYSYKLNLPNTYLELVNQADRMITL